MTHIEKHKNLYIILAIFSLYVLLSLPHLTDNNFWAPDADRIAMDGIFVLDFIKDLPESLFHIYDYTIEYYAKYPALSIGYRPAFFPLVEAFFYFVFGLSYISAKLAVLFFLFLGMLFWFLLVQETHDTRTALISLLLWLTNPFIYKYSQHTMLEIPTLSMCIVCVYYLYKYVSNPSLNYAILLGITTGLALWTNQKAAFLLPLLLIYPILAKKPRLFLLKNSWISYGIILSFLIPLACITIWLGAQNLAQSLGTGTEFNRFSGSQLFRNIYYLYHNHFSVPVLLLALAGVFFTLIRRNAKSLIYISAILCVYLFFTFIKHKIPRYCMYWIPFFCFFASIGLQQIVYHLEKFIHTPKAAIKYAIWGLPILFQLSLLPNVFVPTISGYQEAAQFVLSRTKSPLILVDGYAHSQFIYFVRILDTDRKFIVLRGDKLLASSSISYTNKLQIHLHTKEEIAKALSDFGVQFIVVESTNISNVQIYDKLRELLSDNAHFALRRSIPIESNIAKLENQNLLVYEDVNYKGINKNATLNLRLPVVGQSINMELKRIIPRK